MKDLEGHANNNISNLESVDIHSGQSWSTVYLSGKHPGSPFCRLGNVAFRQQISTNFNKFQVVTVSKTSIQHVSGNVWFYSYTQTIDMCA